MLSLLCIMGVTAVASLDGKCCDNLGDATPLFGWVTASDITNPLWNFTGCPWHLRECVHTNLWVYGQCKLQILGRRGSFYARVTSGSSWTHEETQGEGGPKKVCSSEYSFYNHNYCRGHIIVW